MAQKYTSAIGCFIVFDMIDFNSNGQTRTFTAIAQDVISCPFNRHEPKYKVIISGEGYGIPISMVTSVLPKQGSQLTLW